MRLTRTISALDYHTEGEPMRIVTGGLPPIPGATMLEKSIHFQNKMRDLLGTILYEPRGHRSMCGCILTPPTQPEADLGVIWIEPSGFVYMCGHGALAVATAAVQHSLVVPAGPETAVILDTAAGLVRARVRTEGDRVGPATIRNVDSFAYVLDRRLELPGLPPVTYDIGYGGHFYALVPAEGLGIPMTAEHGDRIVELGERVRVAIERQVPLKHPLRRGAKELLYVQFTDRATHPQATSKNVVVVSPMGIDRSPCGTGTSARMAVLHAKGQLKIGEEFVHESILGTLFVGKLVGSTRLAGVEAVIPEISGRAYCTGINTLVVDPDDPFRDGFLL